MKDQGPKKVSGAPKNSIVTLARCANREGASMIGCEVSVNGQICGVSAIGRCLTDGSAFCMTHQARDYATGRVYVDQCAPCYSAAKQADKKRVTAHENRFGQTYLTKFAHQELKAAEVPTIEILWTYMESVRKAFGRYSSEQRIHVMGTGWLLGSFRWGYNDGGNYGGIEKNDEQLTALVDQWQDISLVLPTHIRLPPAYSTISSQFYGLCRVIKTAKGCEVAGGYSHTMVDLDRVSAAVHELAGT